MAVGGATPWKDPELFVRHSPIFRAERIKTPLGLAMFYNSTSNPRIAGGLVSRLSDYRKFWRMLLDGGSNDGVPVLSPGAVAAMLADQTGGARVFYSAAQPDVGYGLGLWRFLVDASGTSQKSSGNGTNARRSSGATRS